MVSNKNLSLSFIVLATGDNYGVTVQTITRIKNRYCRPISCIVDSEITPDIYNDITKICPVIKHGSNILDLLNIAFAEGPCEWNLVIKAGSFIPKYIDTKYQQFIINKSDVLYPVQFHASHGRLINIKNTFDEIDTNGILINKSFFKEVGFFNQDKINKSMKNWGYRAINLGANFKSVVGIHLL